MISWAGSSPLLKGMLATRRQPNLGKEQAVFLPQICSSSSFPCLCFVRVPLPTMHLCLHEPTPGGNPVILLCASPYTHLTQGSWSFLTGLTYDDSINVLVVGQEQGYCWASPMETLGYKTDPGEMWIQLNVVSSGQRRLIRNQEGKAGQETSRDGKIMTARGRLEMCLEMYWFQWRDIHPGPLFESPGVSQSSLLCKSTRFMKQN